MRFTAHRTFAPKMTPSIISFGKLRGLAAASVFTVLSFSAAHAVDINGRIRGNVTDPTGAQVPDAAVVATNEATGVKFTTKASSTGSYLFAQLPVGTYDISASAPGFKGFKATGIVITIDQEYVEAVTLAIGSTTESVVVQADSIQVNTTDMQFDNVVNSKQIVELPLIGRNFTALETIEPGVQASSDRFGGYSADGSQSQQSSFLINGADVNDIAINTVGLQPNSDAIDQFNLVTGPLNAQYDRNSGGIVSATIKQGTNQFHGDAFEFYRDTFLNTGNYFNYVPATPHHSSTQKCHAISPEHLRWNDRRADTEEQALCVLRLSRDSSASSEQQQRRDDDRFLCEPAPGKLFC